MSEIIGPAGSDMQMLPPTVATFQILNEARKASQHSRMSGVARHSGGPVKRASSMIRQVAAISSPAGVACKAGHCSCSRSISVSVATCGSENSQVPPASQAYPSRHCVISSAEAGRFTSVMVLRFMLRSCASQVRRWTSGARALRPGRRGAHGRSASDVGPGPGVIKVGHCFEPNGTAGGRNGFIPSLALSAMIAARPSPPISS